MDKYVTKPIRSQENIFEIMNSCERGYNWLARSIRNSINFYVEVKGLNESIAEKLSKACKMKPTGMRAIFVLDDEIVEAWENHVSKQPEEITILFKLLVCSGVRAVHAVELRRVKISYRDYTERARYKRVSANTIRKWHYNFMIENGFPESVADFVQRRKPASVGAMHYLAVARPPNSWTSSRFEN